MRKLLVTIVGRDHPGIIYQVSKSLAEHCCNVIEVTQTTLMGQFAGIFSCTMPQETDLGKFNELLSQNLTDSELAHWITEVGTNQTKIADQVTREPYVVTVRGPDQPGIIPEFTGCMSGFDINIENLRVVSLEENIDSIPEPTDTKHQVVMFFELTVPTSVNQGAFRQALSIISESMVLEMSLQHRNIFEAIHRL